MEGVPAGTEPTLSRVGQGFVPNALVDERLREVAAGAATGAHAEFSASWSTSSTPEATAWRTSVSLTARHRQTYMEREYKR